MFSMLLKAAVVVAAVFAFSVVSTAIVPSVAAARKARVEGRCPPIP